MQVHRRDAEERYAKLRRDALESATQVAGGDVRFTEITIAALDAADAWSGDREVLWDWKALRNEYRRTSPKRLEVALWRGADLFALSLGKPAYSGKHLRLDFVEARPKVLGDRGKALPQVLLVYAVYGRLLGAQSIRIMSPLNDSLVQYYESWGYTYVKSGDYLFKELL